MTGIGKHLLAEIYGVTPVLLRDEQTLMAAVGGALAAARFHVLHQVSHRFGEPGGVTGVYVLTESHAAFHTYPEYGYVALDLFSCGDAEPDRVLAAVLEALQPEKTDQVVVVRGTGICTGRSRRTISSGLRGDR